MCIRSRIRHCLVWPLGPSNREIIERGDSVFSCQGKCVLSRHNKWLTAGSSPSLIFLDNSDFFVMGVFCKSTWAIHLITPPPPLPGSLIAQDLWATEQSSAKFTFYRLYVRRTQASIAFILTHTKFKNPKPEQQLTAHVLAKHEAEKYRWFGFQCIKKKKKIQGFHKFDKN